MGEIRERVRHEAALEASEARVRAMLDSALDSVVTIDHEGRVLEFNASAERTFGYARRDVIGKQMVELLVPPRLQAAHSRGLRHYLATGEGPVLGKRIEVPALRADGSEFPIELSIVRVEMPGPPVFTAYVRDISERVLRDAALRESAAIVGSSFDAIVSRTAEGTVTSWNAAAERIFGYRAEEMIGRSIGILAPPERAGELASVNERLRRFGRLEPFETVRVRKDGLRIDVETTVSPIVDTSGELIAVSAISRDISDRKRSETLSAGQARLLGLVAAGTQLAQLLDLVARFVEEQSSEVLTSILLLDPDGVHLRHGAAPSLPDSYTEAVDGIAIGPGVGCCGTAAYRRARVVVSDIANDPLWSDYRQLALDAGLRACWSTPVLATDGALLGTFAMYYREARRPDPHDLELVGMAMHVVSIAVERSLAEEALRTSEQRYRDLFENANEPIAMVSLDETITEVNGAFERVLGYTRAELLGSSLRDYLTPEGYEIAVREGQRKLAGEVSGTTFEQEFVAKDGHMVVLNVSSRIIEENGRPVGIQGICRDITAYKQAQTELRELAVQNRHQALHDSLTGLPNRACFRERIEQAIAASRKDGSGFAVLMIDLDRFKDINDTLGHHYGDLLLVELARRLRSVLRHNDTIARLGGDEFGMLVPDLVERAGGLEPAIERILAALEESFLIDGLPLQVEASIGIAHYPAHGGDVDLLLQRADVAMYLAKQKGATHALYTPELDHHDTSTLTLLSELPRAIRERELVLHYQPKTDAQTGELVGVEALVRWQHPTRGLIGPVEFIPPAERTALIDPLTRFVLDEALAQSKRWQDQGHTVNVAVNLSMRNLHDLTLPDQIAKLLRKSNLPSDRLTLEITESTIASDPERTKAVVQQLSQLGVSIAIDDFGIGYTSLSHLARLAVDQIKIDRSFVTNMETDRHDAAIVRSIITLGHDLGLKVTAEGVETKAAHDKLAALGCDIIQGYHVSRPVPADDITHTLSASPNNNRRRKQTAAAGASLRRTEHAGKSLAEKGKAPAAL
jgi:diguanylate cyclase (GGDEF)-like protein/PAS domain S-box-containing protein